MSNKPFVSLLFQYWLLPVSGNSPDPGIALQVFPQRADFPQCIMLRTEAHCLEGLGYAGADVVTANVHLESYLLFYFYVCLCFTISFYTR